MGGTINEFLVFMASPSDLAEEREIIRTVVDETNALIASTSAVRFRVAGWENTLPAAGRPQGLINPEVDRCDIFIGLLKHRWGSPTGEYSSGFEEEYTLAQSRFDETGQPSMHLFFGQVPRSLAEDPGVSLQQVLAFKERITTERRALYRQFEDPHDLARQVQTVLLDRALSFVQAPEAVESGSPSAEGPPTPAAVAVAELDQAREQMSAALTALVALVRGEVKVDVNFDQDRVELLARAFGKDRDVLGGHFVNRLFQRRRDLVLSVGEARLWVRTLLSDIGRNEAADRTIPGWGALAGEWPGNSNELVDLAASDEPAVAAGAIRVMSEHKLRPPALFSRDGRSDTRDEADTRGQRKRRAVSESTLIVPEMFNSGEIVDRWVEVLNVNPGTSEAVDFFLSNIEASDTLVSHLIESESLNERTTALLKAARAAAAGDPDLLAGDVSVVMLPTSRTTMLRILLVEHLAALKDEALLQVVQRAVGADLRVPAVEQAISRGILSSEAATKAIEWEDSDHLARLVAMATADPDVARVLRGDGKSSKSVGLRADLLARTESHEQLSAARTAQPWDLETWEALLRVAGQEEVAAARTLVDTDASALREVVRPHLAGREDLVEFVANQQRSAAGMFLARRLEGSEDDDPDERVADVQRVIEAARLGHRVERENFIRALADGVRLSSDAETETVSAWLRDIAADLYVSERESLLASPLAEVFTVVALASGEKSLQAAVAQRVAALPSTSDEQLRELIYDADSDVRIAAIGNIISRWDSTRLEGLLDGYASQGRQYWYNVIAVLDDHLYALRD